MSATGTLFIVGTPIGNLEDLTDRARRVLGEVGLVAAEDTRRTGRLLSGLGIDVRLISMFEGNEAKRTQQVVAALGDGTDVALVSDAGMPLLSDPGERLVRACVDRDISVSVVPGPSAAIAALVVSGLSTERVAFEGFLPRRVSQRRTRLTELADDPRTLVVFESPKRAAATLAEMFEAWGQRRVAVARELTKLHEEVLRGSLSELAERLDRAEPRGEIVLVVEGAPETVGDLDAALRDAQQAVEAGSRKRDAAAAAARASGGNVSANAIYRRLVEDDEA